MAEKRPILIVEDDPLFRDVLENILECEGYESIQAENGKAAIELLKTHKPSMVLTDIQMPEMTGVELIEWIKRVYDASFRDTKPLPIIMMTGFAHLLETQKAHSLGVDHFLSKPFEDTELIEAIKDCLKIENVIEHKDAPQQKPKKKDELSDFCKVSLEDFVSKNVLEMDVYVKLTKTKFIKIAHEGENVDTERIQRYRDKGIEFLFVRKEDFRKVLDFNIMLTKVVKKSDTVNVEKKKRFMSHTSEVILENAFVNGVDQECFNDAKEFLLTSMDVLTEDEQTMSLLDILNTHSDYLYAHSLGVSMYSLMIAKQMGWQSSANLFKLSFGGIMHDIGKKEIDPEILKKPRSSLSYTERQILETHPLRGKEILESLKSAPAEVVAIAYDHHENILGQGYPKQLRKSEIGLMAKIVGTADEFCLYALKNENNPGMSAKKALHLVDQYKANQLDEGCIVALKKFIIEEK